MSAERFTKDQVLAALSRHIGAANGANAGELVAEITGQMPTEAGMRALRYAVEELRQAGHHVCAHPAQGYYIAADDGELDRTCEYLYGRAMCSLRQIAAMKRVSLPDLRGQLHLPT